MKRPEKTDSANCFCDVYVAEEMDAYLEELLKDYVERDEVEMKKPEKKKVVRAITSQMLENRFVNEGYNYCVDDYEAFHKHVMEPLVEVYEDIEKQHDHLMLYGAKELLIQMAEKYWNAIQEALKRSKRK